jgi:hypothetical protein
MVDKPILAGLAALLMASWVVPDVVFQPQAAYAQDDPKAKALAVKLIGAGDKAMAAGDKQRKRKREEKALEKYERALKAYEQAYDRFPSPKIFYLMGLAEHKLGRYLEAIRHFRQLLDEAEEVSDALRESVGLSIDEAKQYVVTLVFVVEPAGASISVDGEEIGEAPLEQPYFVAAGEHTIAVSAEGHAPVETTVTLEAGAESERTIALEKTRVVAKKPKPKPKKRKRKKSKPGVNKTPLIAGISATVGLAALATITGLMAVSKHGTFSDETLPAADREAAKDSGKKYALITDLVWLGTAAVGAYTAYYYYGVYKPRKRGHERRMRLKNRRESRLWVVPYASPEGGGVAVSGAF